MKNLISAGTEFMKMTDSSNDNAEQNDRQESVAFVRHLAGLYMILLGVLVALMALMAIVYLEFFQNASAGFNAHHLFEMTSLLAVVLGAFVTYITWRCYQVSGEAFLRWLALAFLGFTLIYVVSIVVFTQASIALTVPDLSNHLWWLSHAAFVAGFLLLSFGVVQAFHTTGSLSTVYSQAEVVEQLRKQEARTEEALAKLEKTNAQLTRLAATDWLTGVANRGHFMWHAKREIARARREGTNLSLLFLDLDHFKRVNDIHGHQAGDEVLRRVTETIADYLRPTDLLARVGGEEFQILLPGADIEQSSEIAERGRLALHDLDIRVGDKILKITVSIGCAQLGPDGDDIDSLIRAGDRHLYEAKELGRDRVITGDILKYARRVASSISSSSQPLQSSQQGT